MTSSELTKLYLSILNKVKDAIIATDTNGNILFSNTAVQTISGLPQKAIKQEWLDHIILLKPGKKSEVENKNHPIYRALRNDRVQNEEYILSPKNKIPRPVLISVYALITENIQNGIIIIIQDITSYKETEVKLNRRSKSLMEAYEGLRRAEAGLKTTNTDLEKRVLERTQNLTRINKELQAEIQIRLKAEKKTKQTNEELIKINKDLDNFIYTASHDLKAPIANIEGLISALKEEASFNNESTKNLMDLICNSVDKFKETISDLTEISKVQKGGDDLIEGLNLQEVLLESTDSIQELIKATQTNLKTDFKCNEIRFSKKNLKSIFYNLISNAIKYRHPKRNPAIKISSKAEKNFCVLMISDNGMGIPEDKKDQIFSMFKRLHDHVEGSGIGLYIVKRIVENCEGKIEVSSEVGQGTTFKIYLPI